MVFSSSGAIWYPIQLARSHGLCSILPLRHDFTQYIPFKQLLLAVVIHLLTSLLVGLLYGAMLPMFPRRQFFLEVSLRRFYGRITPEHFRAQ